MKINDLDSWDQYILIMFVYVQRRFMYKEDSTSVYSRFVSFHVNSKIVSRESFSKDLHNSRGSMGC